MPLSGRFPDKLLKLCYSELEYHLMTGELYQLKVYRIKNSTYIIS